MKLKEEDLMSFIKELLQSDEPVDRQSDLFSTGALDLASMVNLIVFVEGAWGSEIRPEHVTLENFDTPGRILNFIESCH